MQYIICELFVALCIYIEDNASVEFLPMHCLQLPPFEKERPSSVPTQQSLALSTGNDTPWQFGSEKHPCGKPSCEKPDDAVMGDCDNILIIQIMFTIM